MKYLIYEDEAWPVYSISEDHGSPLYPSMDIPDDKVAWIKKAAEEYESVQDYLSRLYDESQQRFLAAKKP